MKTTRTAALAAALLVLAGATAHADTSDVSGSGFTITFATLVDAEPQKVWQAFTQLPKRWNNAHSRSGKASNRTHDASAGGFWCEQWMVDGSPASAVHGRVLLVLPGSALRLQA
jgi:uncharacterized protein YndB with AHSA1/START domain